MREIKYSHGHISNKYDHAEKEGIKKGWKTRIALSHALMTATTQNLLYSKPTAKCLQNVMASHT